ncbi:helix-hairpin-helix domain-containing protein [Paenibacillus sp. FSL R7-0273]|uniref:ComEA family DNA-binding protein n=1 Tax=Paenibacillus sp. FSL R7-0273 TaxID=1536772 RepID=UPI0006942C65|nr:helix-hairpin-helix domain-containing protein [Paenibacillus sp. FSL R7-0273]
MNKRVISCAIAALLLGGGLVWSVDQRGDAGISGWETLNAAVGQTLGAGEEAGASPDGAAEGAGKREVAEGGNQAAEAVPNGGTGTVGDSTGFVDTNEVLAAPGAAAPVIIPESTAAPAAADGRINVNTADAAALMDLPGIGEKKAQAIIDYRDSKGAYRSLADLGKVKGIGPKMLEKLEALVVF